MARLRQNGRRIKRLGIVLAIFAGGVSPVAAQVAAQNLPDTGLLRPERDGDRRVTPRFEPPKYGNAPGSGAGSTGFISTNLRRKPKPKSGREIAVQNLPPVNVRGNDATVAPVFRQAPRVVPRSPYPLGASNDPATTFMRPVKRRSEEDPYAPIGLRTGSFILKPAVEISTGYDSNPGRIANGVGSGITQIAPELLAKSEWSRHELSANLRGNYSWYNSLPSYDRPDFDGKVAGRLDITSQTHADVEGRYQYSADTPGNPNLPTDVSAPTVYTTSGVTAGLTHRFNRLEVSVKGNADRSEYQDAKLNDGTTASQAERNFDQYSGQLRGSYEFYPGIKPFVEVGIDTRIHDLERDSSGIRRDSDGRTIKAGSTFELSRRLTGEISAGYTLRDYKDPTLSQLSGLIADASLIWAATPLNTVTFTAKSSVDESTIQGVSGILHREAGIQIDHSFRRWLIGTAKLAYGLDTFQGGTREDQRYNASLGLVYKLSRTAQLKGEFRQERLRSNVEGVDYTANIVMVGLRLQM